jgi:hypothetical protein
VSGEPAAEAPASAAAPAASTAVVAPPGPPAAAVPAEPEVLAKDTSPPGVARLSKEEAEAAKKTCAPLAEAIAKAAQKRKPAGPAERNAFIEEILANPPKLPKVDVAHCADLLLRDMRGYVAAMVESEAHMAIGRIVVGLATALELEPPALCASAGPVPTDLGALAAGPWISQPGDWAAPGWKCARFALSGEAQRFQYQLVTDAAAGTWEIVARGFPVKGGEPTELYAHGRLEGGHIKPSREVYRRKPRR